MILRSQTTRERLIDAAYRILSEESLSQLSLDRVSKRAGLSRRTFFLHFSSKDELLAAVLDCLRPAYAAQYRQWSDGLAPDLGVLQRITAIFHQIIASISQPGWKGSSFLRVSAEFGELAGHPVHAAVAGAQRDMEQWFESELSRGAYADATLIARQLTLLVNGLLIMQLVHRQPDYGAAVLSLLPGLLAAPRSA